MASRSTSIILLLTAFIATAYGMGIYLFATLVPDMRADLELTPRTIGLISGLAQAGTMGAALLIGPIWGRFGALFTMMAAQAILGVSMLAVGFSGQSWQIMILLT